MASVQEVLNKASNEIGVKESPPNSNSVKYNNVFYGRAVHDHDVSPTVTYPWCCSFVWWVLSSCGIKVPKTASCMTLGQWFKDQGRWYTSDPKPGDVVFFHFKTNNRWTNHVGIVTGIRGKEIETIEGNTSVNSDDNGGAVMARRRSSHIVGYGRPQYSEQPEMSLDLKPILKRGDKGNYVKAWQEYLKTCNIDIGPSGADGDFGPYTERAVKLYQRTKGLPVTGIIDQDDWNSVGK